MNTVTWLTGLAVVLAGCGVKGPPVSPVRVRPPSPPVICSPYSADCLMEDEFYDPTFDPTAPDAEKRWAQMEERRRVILEKREKEKKRKSSSPLDAEEE